MDKLNHILKGGNGSINPKRPETKKSLFIFGIGGFCGKRLARYCATELNTEFVEVSGTVHSLSDPAPQGYKEFLIGEDGALPAEAILALNRATQVLSTVPTNTDNTLDDGIIEHKAKCGTLEWAGYLSTTATYGDRGGSLADEDDEVDEANLSERGRARFSVEERWRKTGAPIHIFRLPGIYGPGRGPLTKARAPTNRLLLKENQVFCRVHVDDIVQALVLSMRKPNPGRIYNICDDEPAASHTASLYAYSLLGNQPPPLVRYEDVENDLTPMARSFYSECKRISNGRARKELGFNPIYSSYREGFTAQLREEQIDYNVVPVGSSLPVKRFSSKQSSGLPPPSKISRQRVFIWLQTLIAVVRHTLRQWYRRLCIWFILRVLGCTVLLVDNGSVRPAATLGMRRIANKLQERLHTRVVATSWRYADRIDATKLNGTTAMLFAKALQEAKTRFVVVVPLFLGPSSVVSKEIPKIMSRPRQLLASALVEADTKECEVASLLQRAAMSLISQGSVTRKTKIILVDHGSPSRDVNRVRRALAARLRAMVYPATVIDCSMERREEPEYDFNDPTLEKAFSIGGLDSGEVIVVPAFLFPGNHAGPGGDIETIIAQAVQRNPGLVVKMGPLLMDEANDDMVLQILASKVCEALM